METSVLLIAIFTGVIALSSVALLGALAYLAVFAKKLIDTSVKPAMASVNSLVDKVEDSTERIMDVSEDTVRKVSGAVKATTHVVQDSVTSPLISFSSLLAGISKAMEAWRRASAKS
ncbi:MAG TPA: hypothetical protein VMX94_02740 [Armatimonadota bacterium]|nr:hypothetical protein [Armatimonadota bacterium]